MSRTGAWALAAVAPVMLGVALLIASAVEMNDGGRAEDREVSALRAGQVERQREAGASVLVVPAGDPPTGFAGDIDASGMEDAYRRHMLEEQAAAATSEATPEPTAAPAPPPTPEPARTPTAGQLTEAQAIAVLSEAGWPAELHADALAVACGIGNPRWPTGESDCRPDAHGDGGASLGLFQIQPRWHLSKLTGLGYAADPGLLLDPVINARVALVIYQDSRWSLWSVKPR